MTFWQYVKVSLLIALIANIFALPAYLDALTR